MSTRRKTRGLIIDYPFPLSDGTLVFVSLPDYLTVVDAERLCAMIRALADIDAGTPAPEVIPVRETGSGVGDET